MDQIQGEFPNLDWSKAVEYSNEGKGKDSGKGKKGKGNGKGKGKGNVTRNPNNGRFQANTVQVQDGDVEAGFEFAEREGLSGNQPHRVLTVVQPDETANQFLSFEEVPVEEENVTPPGNTQEWIDIPGSQSHHIYAWPRHIGSSEVEDVIQQQEESNNAKPFKIEARCVECSASCPVKVIGNNPGYWTGPQWTGHKPGYQSLCFCGTRDFLSRKKIEQITLTGGSDDRQQETPANIVCEYCNNGCVGLESLPFNSCGLCGASPSYHHGRCCTKKPVERPHSIRSEIGSVQSGKTLLEVSEERPKEIVIDSCHSENDIFILTYDYVHMWTPSVKLEDATIVKTYLEREGVQEWIAKRVKVFKKAQKSKEIVQNLQKIIHEDMSSSNSSDYSSWQQVDTSPSGNSFGREGVRLTDDNIPYAVSDRQKFVKIAT